MNVETFPIKKHKTLQIDYVNYEYGGKDKKIIRQFSFGT